MRPNRLLILLGCASVAALAAPLEVHANPVNGSTVSMELTGVTGTAMAGYDTSPYFALVGPGGLTQASQFTSANSFSTPIFCDDFLTEVGVGLIWQATVTNMSALSGLTLPDDTLKFDNGPGYTATEQQQAYMAEAWLAEQILGVNQSTPAGQTEAAEMTYAMWGIFDFGALSGLTPSEFDGAFGYGLEAYFATENDTPSDFSNVYIFTPDPQDSSQEYLAVLPVPEPATLPLLAVGLMATVAWRRKSPSVGTGLRRPDGTRSQQ